MLVIFLFFFVPKMRYNVNKVCAGCTACKQAKSRLQPHDLYPPLPIFNGRWIDISMDFVLGLPKTTKAYHSIFIEVGPFYYLIPFHKMTMQNILLFYSLGKLYNCMTFLKA